MLFREFLLPTDTILILSIFLQPHIHSILYKSPDVHFNCSSLFHRTVYESYLLSEGDGVILSCNVCSECFRCKEMCELGVVKSGLLIPRVETTSIQSHYASDTNLFVAPYPTSLERIRLRLRKRIWQNISSLLNALPLLYDDGHLKAEVTKETNLKAQNLSSLYFTVTKPGQPTSVIKTSTTSTYLSETILRIKNAKFEHTGIYRCIFKGEVIRAWSVTVLKPGDEPFRNLFSRLKIIQEKPELISGNTSNGDDEDSKSLVTQHLIKNNLKLHTHWNSWSECVPCTPEENSSFTKSGMQIRIGICHVTLIDRFHSIKPHILAVETEEVLKLFSGPGLPCRSHLIRSSMLKYGPKEIKLRPSELMIRSCIRECPGFNNITTLSKSPLNKLSRLPKRIAIQVNEGEPLIITCPIRNSVEKPITWFYAPDNFDELMKLIKIAYNFTTIIQYKTPLRYLITKLKQVNFTTLIRETRGRYRIDSAYNIIVAETVSLNKTQYKELHSLICIHGDAYSIPNGSDIYPDWSGIIYIDVLPQSSLARILSKLTPVIQIMMPFVLALGIFFMIMLTLYTERRPKMRLAAKGLVVK
ncbi:unnamed protein product [Schistosoma curassoni]|uniref:Ig-like domain-containing protein n=1 Tax=Schistosoma curassoni TaxID=6186 RepID=A0A183JDM9_9TREM|nr:unnamed protein product [Schistosoma curassoni]VDO63829.1 unnamed protein product [Schistosoma curassoni]